MKLVIVAGFVVLPAVSSSLPTPRVVGARGRGPDRAAGIMVVVPSATTVTLTQGPGAVQWLADVVALAGPAGLVALFVIDRRWARASFITSSGDTDRSWA